MSGSVRLPHGGRGSEHRRKGLLAPALSAWRLLPCLLVCAAACSASPQQRATRVATRPQLDVYGRLPRIEDVALSPHGTRIAIVLNRSDERFVVVTSVAGGAALGELRVGKTKLRGIQWVDDGHLLLTTSVTALPKGLVGMRSEWSMLQTYDIGARKVRPLLEGFVGGTASRRSTAGTMNVAFGPTMVRRVGGKTVLFVHGYYVTDRIVPGLFKIDLATNREALIQEGSSATERWLVDDAGNVVAEEQYDERDQRWALLIRRDGRWREVASEHDPYRTKGLVGFGPSDGSLLVVDGENGEFAWKPLSLPNGSWGLPLAEATTWSEPLVDPATQRVVGGVSGGGDRRYVFLDRGMQARWDSILRSFEGERVRLISWSEDSTKIVVLVEGRRSGLAYQLVDFDRNVARLVGRVYDDLEQVSPVRRITYRAADGLQIGAYLTLPTGRPPQRLPLVVLPHGGPAQHETGKFDWWAQALAAQGYAILQPNYRGSDVDSELLAAGFGEFGRKMQTDLSDGVRFLARAGTIDPARVCIVGASYGGYAALAGVALEPSVYRCAVAVAGISDLRGFLRWVDERAGRRSHASQRFWSRFMGTRSADDPRLDAISPIAHLDTIAAPVLLIHGRDDTVVPYEQSRRMADSLRRRGKPVELLTLSHEDHWLSHSDTRLQMLRRCVAFLRAHNPTASSQLYRPPSSRSAIATARTRSASMRPGNTERSAMALAESVHGHQDVGHRSPIGAQSEGTIPLAVVVAPAMDTSTQERSDSARPL